LTYSHLAAESVVGARQRSAQVAATECSNVRAAGWQENEEQDDDEELNLIVTSRKLSYLLGQQFSFISTTQV